MRKSIVVVTLAVFFAGFAWNAARQERLLAHGAPMFMELAPRDPRAFLLGDYMEINAAVNDDVRMALWQIYSSKEAFNFWGRRSSLSRRAPVTGTVVVSVAGETSPMPGVLSFKRLDDGSPLLPGEHRLRYRVSGSQAYVGSLSFYFQEGYAPAYEKASYGRLMVADDGQALLVSLHDKDFKLIRPLKNE